MGGFQNDPGTLQQEAGFGFDGRFWTESINSSITAKASGTQANATPLDSMINFVTTVASANDAVGLPPAKAGLSVCVSNQGANQCQVFAAPGSSDTINGIAAATGVPQIPGSQVWYTCVVPSNPINGTAGKWIAQGLGGGYSGSQQTYSYKDGLTATASGNQTNGTSITTSMARFTTVATAGDASTLMPAVPGLAITVINAGAQAMSMYPASAGQGGVSGGDQINSLGQNAAFSVPAGAVVDLYCTIAGTWHTIMTSTAPNQTYSTAANTTNFTATGTQICGGQAEVYFDLTGTLGSNQALTLPTVAQLVAAMTAAGLNPQPGMTWELTIIYRNGTNTWTVTTNTGWTLTNTMTITGAGVGRKFIISLTTLSAAVIKSIGTVTYGAA